MTLDEFKRSLGAYADAFTDAELSDMQAFQRQFVETLFEWWAKRQDRVPPIG
jgi:hypothetical protein